MSPRWTRAIEEGKHGVAALPGRPAMSGDAHRAEWHTLPPTLASVLVAALMFMMTTLLHVLPLSLLQSAPGSAGSPDRSVAKVARSTGSSVVDYTLVVLLQTSA